VVATDSGLQYRVLESSDGWTPLLATQCDCHHQGSLIDGKGLCRQVEDEDVHDVVRPDSPIRRVEAARHEHDIIADLSQSKTHIK
jgi:hypothetical protein